MRQFCSIEYAKTQLAQLRELVAKEAEAAEALRGKMDVAQAQVGQVKADTTSFRTKFDNIERQLKEIKYVLGKKADTAEINQTMDKYCSYSNLKDVYDRVVPPVQTVVEKMADYSK